MAKPKSKKIICNSCGGKFKEVLPKCPFCDSFHYRGAEAAYFEKLEDIREQVQELGEIPEAETKKEFYKQGKFLIKVFIILAVIVALSLLLLFWSNHEEKRDPQADYLWKKQNHPIMNELYEQEKYDELIDFYLEAMDADYPVGEWEHSDFCWLLVNVQDVQKILERERRGETLSESNYSSLLYYGWKMEGLAEEDYLEEEEWQRLQPLIQPIIDDFESRWDFTEEELKAFEKEKAHNYNYVSFDFCDKYIRKWMKGRMNQ